MQFRFTLQIVLIDKRTDALILAREFDAVAPVTGSNPAAAVGAANQAVSAALQDVATACAAAVARRP